MVVAACVPLPPSSRSPLCGVVAVVPSGSVSAACVHCRSLPQGRLCAVSLSSFLHARAADLQSGRDSLRYKYVQSGYLNRL